MRLVNLAEKKLLMQAGTSGKLTTLIAAWFVECVKNEKKKTE
jgi:hypothetical protein